MPRQGDLRSDVETSVFVELRHGWGTQARRAGCAAAILACAGCGGDYSALAPAGPGAEHAAWLWWIMLAGGALILTGVMAAALWSLRSARGTPGFSDGRVLIGWGLVFPVAVLGALMVAAFASGERLTARPAASAAEIGATARQWSWTFHYPGGRTSEGVLHVPAGETFHLAVRSEDVIHSLWVPRLGGKIDAIPGRANRIALRADVPGRYHGQCAEYCGIGHVHMPFLVEAHGAEDLAAALAALPATETAVDVRPPEPRRSPASEAILDGADHVLRWLGIAP